VPHHVKDLAERPPLDQRSSRWMIRCGIPLPQLIGKIVCPPARRDSAEILAVIKLEASPRDAAEAVRLLQDSIKDGREIAGR
jgi:hypothetical protein